MLLYINWDGFSASWYRMAHASPLGTPNLDNLIAQGTVLLQQRCGIPAITNPMQQALISGAWPEKAGNCYCYFDKAARRIVKTGRLNPCETIAEAAVRHGLTCASIHGWYVENRRCTPGDAGNPYIADISLRNFEGRVQLLLDYLAGKPVPSGGKMITLLNRPDFLTIYADDIDTVCHNGARLPYAEMRRASTIDEWYENIQYAVWRMDQALERLMRIPGVTIALASDHGGMPYGIAGFGADADEAALPRLAELVQAIQREGVAVAAIEKEGDPVPADAQAVLLAMETQAQLTWLVPASEGRQRAVLEGIRALPFVRAALDQNAQRALSAWPGMCDIYITTRSPYYLCGYEGRPFAGGSHAALEDTVMDPFCAFWGAGVRRGVKVQERTSLVDFAPTACRLLGIEGPQDAVGRILTEALEERAAPALTEHPND